MPASQETIPQKIIYLKPLTHIVVIHSRLLTILNSTQVLSCVRSK